VDTFAVFSRNFFARPTLKVARDLLGTVLCRRCDDGSVLSAAIIEVEGYTADDPACHAYRGLTKRCSVMFGEAGHAYVYFIYGMYFCLNVVTEPEGTPGAVLLRAIDLEGGNGPGKLCRLWNITKAENGVDLCHVSSPIWIAKGKRIADDSVVASSRIGLSVATEHLWRFHLKDHPGVSGMLKRTRRNKTETGAQASSLDEIP
jgi:DNA-3-methyladenine glycosylase